MSLQIDKAEIVRAMTLLYPPGSVVELRALDAMTAGYRGAPHTVSGYFNDFEKMAACVPSIQRACGIYFTLNAVNPALLARASNRLRDCSKKEPTTSDNDIQARRYLLIDADPDRPAGISSTDAEHDAALAKARAIETALAAMSWPRPILADSGNGAHLLYSIDLPADDAELVSRVLKGIAATFNKGDGIKIDESVFNPARICKLYGTISAKGDNTPDRPHRLSKILDVPDEMKIVPKTLLEEMAARAPATERKTANKTTGNDWIDDFIRQHNLDVADPEKWQGGGRRWIFRVCPFNPEHQDRSAGIFQHAGGAVSFKCHHNGCNGNDWAALRNKVDPDWQERKATFTDRSLNDDGAQPDVDDIPPDIPADEPEPAPPAAFKMLRECLDNPELRKRVRRISTGFPQLDEEMKGGLLLCGMYIIAAATGNGKTTLADNMARRQALAGVRTLLISLEMPEVQISRCLLAASAQVPVCAIETFKFTQDEFTALKDARGVLNDLPLAIDDHTSRLDAIELLIKAAAAQGFKVVVIDQLSWIAAEGANPFERAANISRRIKAAAKDAGVVVILLVQINRAGSQKADGPDLYDLRDSGTLEQDADGVIVIRKVERFVDGRPANMSLAILKHRHGPQGDNVRVNLSWFMPEARIETYEPWHVTGARR